MDASSTHNPTRPTIARPLWALLLVALGLVSTGCPTYEDTYSGSFREVVEASGRTSDAIAVDFFRFGDNAAAIVRIYKRDPITGDPFGEQEFCTWTTAEPFDEDQRKFRLYINKSSTQLPRSQLFGTITADGEMEITLFDERTGEPYDGVEGLALEQIADEPDTDCELVEDFVVQVDFPRDPQTGGLQAMPPEANYAIENPVLAVSWVGVQPVRNNTSFAPVTRHTPTVLLDDQFGSNYDPGRHALKNDRTLLIPPPPDTVRMPSGTTTMALGHFVVVDDSLDDRPDLDGTPNQSETWQFSWDTDAEKLVATTLQRATRPSCSSGTNHWGRALLFVEDDIANLSTLMKGDIDGYEQCEPAGTCERHFFIVDICAEDDEVRDIQLGLVGESTGSIPTVPLFVTDEYLSADTIPLPRVNPYVQ
ncbi:hypothetical protein FIV42_09885 [Persicimonas caeni]|uniref:Uncharacterized protein n=1 Tax=Persicimonas caeni TaxID=2292766 RepID=A0A4Y6PS24_PERCE|nr:hypothetical protein [Persicimonas caeni]QDG51030.1 hypothetical protein FIV42_09885 [Persicimonas caeni]QED32251.1 hypothetical protein FRD00_09880 [Persicimonas caeni]